MSIASIMNCLNSFDALGKIVSGQVFLEFTTVSNPIKKLTTLCDLHDQEIDLRLGAIFIYQCVSILFDDVDDIAVLDLAGGDLVLHR